MRMTSGHEQERDGLGSTGEGMGGHSLSEGAPDWSQGVPGWIDRRLLVPEIGSRDRLGAIKELVDQMRVAGCVGDSLSFLQSVLDRESLSSTVVGRGVAVPHARSRSAKRLSVVLGVSEPGIEFGSEAHPQAVHVVCLVAVPAARSGAYLGLLGLVSEMLQDDTLCQQLIHSDSSDAMYRLLDLWVSRPGKARPPLASGLH